MKIQIRETPKVVYELVHGEFSCCHVESHSEDWVENCMGFDGHYQNEGTVEVCSNPDCDYEFEPTDPHEDDYDRFNDR